MHWILTVTLMTTGSGRLMGSYDSEEACQKALRTLFEITSVKNPISAGCFREDDRLLKLFER